jgi:peptidoglycan/xylan/chitin deacetylase (PgdA/CDA1 family)
MVLFSLLAVSGTIALGAPGANSPGSSVAGAGGTGSLAFASATAQGDFFGFALVPKQCQATDPGVPIFEGPPGRNQVALTFDDGPEAETLAFLDVLKEKDVEATFYVVGQLIPGNEAILQRAVAEGHSVGNHTLHHENVAEGGPLAKAEVNPTTRMITQATGLRPCTFRPPYGAYDTPLENFLKQEDLEMIRWNIDTQDALGALPETIFQEVKLNLQDGSIILMHDGGDNSQNTLSVLPRIIDYIRKQGYELVTIPEMLGLETDEPALAPVPVTIPPELQTETETDDQDTVESGDSATTGETVP